MSSNPGRYRDLPLAGSLAAHFEARADGATLIASPQPLQPYPPRLTDRLLRWAGLRSSPSTHWRPSAIRAASGVASATPRRWSARAIAQALIDLGLSNERPVAILSDNNLEQLLLGLGAMLAGVPVAPISAAYSIVSQDYGKSKHILGVLTPSLVFASNASAYAKAIVATVPADVTVVLTTGSIDGRATRSNDRTGALPDATVGRVAAGGAGVARGQPPVPEAAGQTRGIRASGRRYRREHGARL